MCSATTEAERRPLVVSVPIPLRTQRTGVPTRRKALLWNYGKQKSDNEHLPAILFCLTPHFLLYYYQTTKGGIKDDISIPRLL